MPSACQSDSPAEMMVAPRFPWYPGLVTLKRNKESTINISIYTFAHELYIKEFQKVKKKYLREKELRYILNDKAQEREGKKMLSDSH